MRFNSLLTRIVVGSFVVGLIGALAVTDVSAFFGKRRACRAPILIYPEPCPNPVPTVRVRKNINHLSETELASLKRGVAAMKALPPDNPRSWRFQANIHGTNDPIPPSGVGLFKTCQHGVPFFFVWHRGYLYNFERILRDLSGDPNLTLPYWDWETDPTLPVAFRNPADLTGPNPLFDGTRNINDGSALPKVVVVDNTLAALALIPFFQPLPSFSRQFEGSPHGAVHNLTGGNMTTFETAGQDPIFWLHHCNIDRNLDRWLNQGGGRLNPSDSTFLDKPYSFVDDSASKITVKVRDILDSLRLGYRYEDTPSPQPAAVLATLAAVGHTEAIPLRAAASFKDDKPPVVKKSLGLKPTQEALHLTPKHLALWKKMDVRADSRGKVFLKISEISAKQPPVFVYGIYVNLPTGELSAEQKRKHFAGTVDFFGKSGPAMKDHGDVGEGGAFTQTFDITGLVATLQKENRWQPESLSVTFEPLTPIASKGNEAAMQQRLEASAKAAAVTYQHVEVLFAP